jgi:hypothetical protein
MKPLQLLNFCRNQRSGLRVQPGRPGFEVRLAAALLLVILIGSIGPRLSRAQVVSAGDQGGASLSAGVLGSGYTLQYGQRKMAGIAGFVDFDTKRRLGIEAEGRWLEYFQTANVHAETYSIGGRYHFDVGRFQPYAKGLVGLGDFNFPYNYAHGRYFVVTAGGGLDFHWTHRIYIRAVDFEYQDWPQFTFGNMNSFGVNAGLRVRIF